MAATVADDRIRTSDMLHRIFRHFDDDGDGRLDRREMAALVLALNPRIKFTREQIGGVVDQVFQFYSKADSVTLGALLCIYEDVAGDVHADFDALFLGHDLLRHDSSASPENIEHAEEREEGDVGYLPTIPDGLPEADPFSPSRSEDYDYPSEFDYDGCAWPLDVSPSFQWLLSRRDVAGDEPEGDVAHLSSPKEPGRLPSTDTWRDSSPLYSEDDSSESDYGGGPPPQGTGEMPSLRWMLSPSIHTQRETSDPPSLASSSFNSEAESSDRDVGGYPPQAELEEIPSLRWMLSPSIHSQWETSDPPSLASSSLNSEAESSDRDVRGYPPQSELEEIPSPTFRWPSSPATSLQKGAWYAPPPPDDVIRDHGRGRGNSSSSWAGIRKLGAFYRLRNFRRKS